MNTYMILPSAKVVLIIFQRFVESCSIMSCYNELISIEKSELRVNQQLQAFNVALQNINESVEVTDSQLCTEVR